MSQENLPDVNPIDIRKVKQVLDEFLQKATQGANGMGPAGTMPRNSISDHLPIIVLNKENVPIAISYNMLSDQHIYNNLVTISGVKEYKNALKNSLDNADSNMYIDRLHIFFYEMAEYSRRDQGFVDNVQNFFYNEHMFESFLESDFFCRKPKDFHKAKSDRQEIGNWIKKLQNQSVNGELSKQDIALSVAQALQEVHHIEYGGLKHGPEIEDSRLNLLSKSGLLRQFHDVLQLGGFINLQECTNPAFILSELKNSGANYNSIVQYVDTLGQSMDNCVIIYNADIFKVPDESQIKKFKLKGEKPAIVAAFEKIDTMESIIVGSIHHPGGAHNVMDSILEQIDSLIEKFPESQVIITGDFNHTKEFFETNGRLIAHSSEHGTMAGPDYGNQNKSIDIAFTRKMDGVVVQRIGKGLNSIPSITSEVTIKVQLNEEMSDTILGPREYFAQKSLENARHITKSEIDLDMIGKLFNLEGE